MRNAYTLETPRARPAGDVGRWVEVAAWLVAFALLLAAPCAPEPPSGGGAARAADRREAVSGPRADAQRPP